MNVLDFKKALQGGGARANQFRVQLDFPNPIGASVYNGQFLCTATSLPGSNIGIAPVHYRGREIKIPGERTFQNWSITIINDTNFEIRDSFEVWMNAINSVKENTGITNPLEVTKQMQVWQMDRNGADLKGYNFVDLWPVNISEIALSFNQNDQLEEFTVELAYAYWEPL